MQEVEIKWANELKKHQTRSKSKRAIPIAKRHEDTTNKMEYFKILLERSINEKDEEKTKEYFEKLVDLRIELMHHNLEALYDRYGVVPDVDRKLEIEHLHRDCARLAASADFLIETQTSGI